MIRKVFGYSPDGDARKFPLRDGESLPEGWSPEPFPGFARHELDDRPERPAPPPPSAPRKRKPRRG